MKEGLIIGKFSPLHKGHIALVEFAIKYCENLSLIVCYTDKETIPGELRLSWLNKTFSEVDHISIIGFHYDENELPNTSVSSEQTALAWAKALSKIIDTVDVVFSSEPYGDYLANYFSCKHILFDNLRKIVPVSASNIKEDPLKYWNFIADACKTYFIKKIAIIGTESTGKTTLTEMLGKTFNTNFVHETAREIIEQTEECTYDDLGKIAVLQAETIIKKMDGSNKLLFVDTELNITKSYSRFLFNKKLIVDEWIENLNKFDLYLYLESDCPFVQDGTRLNEEERIKLDKSHKEQFKQAGISFISITGNWDERFNTACTIIKNHFKIKES